MDGEKIGRFIAQLRKEKGWSQAELGNRLGVTNKTVSRWENGNYMPDISLMQIICREFEININELLSGERLNDERFRPQSDENMVMIMEEQKKLLRKKRITDFLEGGGTGLLISALNVPDGIRRNIIAGIGIIMILTGWYRRKKLFQCLSDNSALE